MANIEVRPQYNEEMQKLVREPALPEKFNDRFEQLLDNDRYLKEKTEEKLDKSEKGAADGVAELDSNGLVPSSQLPSFVDDVVEGFYHNGGFYEDAAHTNAIQGESGKLYVDLSSGQPSKNVYRWSGRVFVVISNEYRHPSPYEPNTSGLYKITTDACGHVVETVPVKKEDITALGIPAQDTNTTYGPATTTSAGLMSGEDKEKLNGIATGANKITIDSALKDNSINPVQNKVVKKAIVEIETSLFNTVSKTISNGSAYVFQNVDVRFGSIVIVQTTAGTTVYTQVYVVAKSSLICKIYESGSTNIVSVSVSDNKLNVLAHYSGASTIVTARIIY